MSHETNKQLGYVTRELTKAHGLKCGPAPSKAKVLIVALVFAIVTGLLLFAFLDAARGQSGGQDKAQWEAIADLREKGAKLAEEQAALRAKVEGNDRLLWWLMGLTGLSGATALQVARRTIERRKQERQMRGESQ